MKNIIILSLLLLTIFINFNKLLAKSDTTSINNLKLNQSSNIIIDEIKILGNKKTKENIILRELTLKEGIIISKDKFLVVDRGVRTLQSLRFFVFPPKRFTEYIMIFCLERLP